MAPSNDDVTAAGGSLAALQAGVQKLWTPDEGFLNLDWDGGRVVAAALVQSWLDAGSPLPDSWRPAEKAAFREELEQVRLSTVENAVEHEGADPDEDVFPERPEGSPFHWFVFNWLYRGCPAPIVEEEFFSAIRDMTARYSTDTLVRALRWYRSTLTVDSANEAPRRNTPRARQRRTVRGGRQARAPAASKPSPGSSTSGHDPLRLSAATVRLAAHLSRRAGHGMRVAA